MALFVSSLIGSTFDHAAIFWAALLAGAIFVLAPFHTQKVLDGQLEVASMQWLPLCFLFLTLFFARPSWWRGILSGLALLWVGLGTWYYGLFALICAGLAIGLWVLWGEFRLQASGLSSASASPHESQIAHYSVHSAVRRLAWGTLPIAVWFVLMTPRLISLAQTGDTYLGDARGEKALSSADLISFWLPNPNHPLWGASVSAFYLNLQPEAQLWNVAVGLIGLLLALLGAMLSWRQSWRWAVLALATAVLAMGTQLTVFGVATGIPLPYALIADLPGVRSSHRPNHFVALTILFVALLAAFAVFELLRRWRKRQAPLALGLLLAIFAIDGWAGSLPLFSRPVPQPYLAMPAAEGRCCRFHCISISPTAKIFGTRPSTIGRLSAVSSGASHPTRWCVTPPVSRPSATGATSPTIFLARVGPRPTAKCSPRSISSTGCSTAAVWAPRCLYSPRWSPQWA
ncbi:hypothetical protein HC891_20365 [Candidatus Gracilibacteria bacterium]|nr:hypothetical protein [Candidatus Gracilibacteria bacterium]